MEEVKIETLNESKYGKLLSKTLPRVIHNDKELQHFTDVLLELDGIEEPTPEQDELAELLTSLIASYEEEHYRLRKSTPSEMIQFLMDQRGLSPKDLIPIVGSKGIASDIINGKRNIGVAPL